MGIGGFIISTAFGPLNTYRNKISMSSTRKKEVEDVIDIYDVKYDVVVKFGKKYHGIQEAEASLDISKGSAWYHFG